MMYNNIYIVGTSVLRPIPLIYVCKRIIILYSILVCTNVVYECVSSVVIRINGLRHNLDGEVIIYNVDNTL